MTLRILTTAAAVCLAWPSAAVAYETDQYSLRQEPLEDAVEQLNAQVNEALVEIAADWDEEPDPRRFARDVYQRLGGRHWVDRLERWAIRRPEVAKLDQGRHGIYGGLPFWATRVNFFFGTGPTISVAGVRIGTDKIGHFLSQGWKYHRRHLDGRTLEQTVRLGTRNEASIFGSPATGAFSNADLVANYEGLLFYRSLFEDAVVGDNPAIVEWTPGGARIARPFDFRDHINDFWDEALNPNRFDRLLSGPMLKRLASLCGDYLSSPGSWVSRDDTALRTRYAHLGLRDGTAHRLDRVCGARATAAAPQGGS